MKTRNGLKSNAKAVSIEVLNARLADAIDLALLTKQAHWNIKGPQFIALHEMIDTFRTEIDGHVDTIAERAVQLGARGYVTKSNPPEILTAAVAEVAAGGLALSPDIAKSIAVLKLSGEQNLLEQLSAREFEIFRLLAAGRPVTEIARLLNLSGKTVANYHSLIKQKLNLSSDVELVLLAQRQEVR